MLMRDVNAFRERFNYWKSTGELPYEAGLPKYAPGKDNDRLLNYVAEKEGFSSKVYEDKLANGLPTIGYGFTDPAIINKYSKTGMTKQQAREILRSEINKRKQKLATLVPHWDELNQNQRDSLTSYYYNFPFHNDPKSKARSHYSPALFKALAARNYNEAARQMDAGMKQARGLRNRRLEEQKWFLEDLQPRTAYNPNAAVEMIESAPKWNPVGYQVPSYGTDKPYYDPSTPEYLSRANASYQDGYSFVPSHNTMLKNAVDMLNENTQLYQPTFNITQ